MIEQAPSIEILIIPFLMIVLTVLWQCFVQPIETGHKGGKRRKE